MLILLLASETQARICADNPRQAARSVHTQVSTIPHLILVAAPHQSRPATTPRLNIDTACCEVFIYRALVFDGHLRELSYRKSITTDLT